MIVHDQAVTRDHLGSELVDRVRRVLGKQAAFVKQCQGLGGSGWRKVQSRRKPDMFQPTVWPQAEYRGVHPVVDRLGEIAERDGKSRHHVVNL